MRYRITLAQNWLFSYDEACEEINILKEIFEAKYSIRFERLNKNFCKEGAVFRCGARLVRRTVDSSGIFRQVVGGDFAYYAEKGAYQFAIFIVRHKCDETFDLMISVEDRNLYLCDMSERCAQWRKNYGNLRRDGGSDVL